MICMLAHINNYNKACIETACHRIIYLLLTEEYFNMDVLDWPPSIRVFDFKQWEGDISTTCKKAEWNWPHRNKSMEELSTVSKSISLSDY